MTSLPIKPGPHKVNLSLVKEELFEMTKMVMKNAPLFYQFKLLGDFENDLVVRHECEIYIWNNENGQLVGFFGHFDLSDDVNELSVICVHPEFQDMGYGRRMMEFYLSLIGDNKKSVLSTHVKNSGAMKFYESFGYRKVKELPNQYGDGQTRVLYEKLIEL